MRVVAIVLAAGAGSRFGSAKQLAPLGGRPLLQHPLDALVAAGVTDVVVVLGEASAEIEAAIEWGPARRRVNPRPGDGISSSLRVGLDAAAEDPGVDAVLVVLGDQPSLTPEVILAVLEAAHATDRPIVRVRWAADEAPNPVLVRRKVWALAAGLDGDRGLGPLLAQHPELVAEVRLPGALPDVDTHDDLARIAAAERALPGIRVPGSDRVH